MLQLRGGAAVVGTAASLCGVCMFSRCLRGLSSGCPVPSHRSESCTLAWLEAGLAPWLVGGVDVTCAVMDW